MLQHISAALQPRNGGKLNNVLVWI